MLLIFIDVHIQDAELSFKYLHDRGYRRSILYHFGDKMGAIWS